MLICLKIYKITHSKSAFDEVGKSGEDDYKKF